MLGEDPAPEGWRLLLGVQGSEQLPILDGGAFYVQVPADALATGAYAPAVCAVISS